ncbi:hypothetical protein LZZ90_05500 [Flavobacterium sp. SM15]|uniref:hypothetical protein n=1 Tax=Flavobacterium sp. SM15 TaxID=2908005 RepID=UPI001EDB5994|nr:hypothetical protein [Flavobacterium sp. SM15]MCG2610955.1 hypothetical protein [Flavobacterium sp. SM15]
MIRFLIISLLSVFFFSCKSYTIPNATAKKLEVSEIKNPYFSNPETDYVYKAHIEVYGRKMGGLFIAKRINDSLHRVVFTTDFGNKLIDFELSETTFKVNYILEDLNRKMIVNTLRDDFRLLLKVNHPVVQLLENEDSDIYKSVSGKRFNYFFISKKQQQLVKLVHTTKSKEKIIFEFDSKNSIFAQSIKINHKTIPLTIELNQISN